MSSTNGISTGTNSLLYSEITSKYTNSIKTNQMTDTLSGKVNVASCIAQNGTFVYSELITKCMNSITGGQTSNALAGKVDVTSLYNASNRMSALDAIKLLNVS